MVYNDLHNLNWFRRDEIETPYLADLLRPDPAVRMSLKLSKFQRNQWIQKNYPKLKLFERSQRGCRANCCVTK